MNYLSALIFLPFLLLSSLTSQAASVPDAVRRDPGPAPSNQRHVDVGGLSVVGPANVSGFAKAPRVLIQTAMGDIEVELDRSRAPFSVTNFRREVESGRPGLRGVRQGDEGNGRGAPHPERPGGRAEPDADVQIQRAVRSN